MLAVPEKLWYIGGMCLCYRSRHPQKFHQAASQKAISSRTQSWTVEEVRMMALLEIANPMVRFINKKKIQADLFPNRTVDSIKGKRREKEYKALIASLPLP